MADEYNTSGNWWDSSRSRFESGTSSSSGLNNLGSFGWPPDMAEIKARSTAMDSISVSGSSVVFQDTQKLQGHDSVGGGDPNLHMMGLGLSTQAMDWNQALLRTGEKAESGFRSMLQENLNSSNNFQQETGMGSSQVQWRERLFSGMSGSESSANEFKQLNRGFSLDQPPFSPQYSSGDSTVTCQGLPTSFQMDSALYGSPSTILQGLLGPDNQPHQVQPNSLENRPMNFPYPANYGVNSTDQLLPASWSPKVPQFLRTSPPKQPPHSQLHFSNNAPFWNASEAAMKDVRPGFFPSLQPQFPPPNFDEKPKQINISEVRESATVGKKSGSEATSKRPRNETPSPLPAFKVRKEKMGDRITALQQLVSPFGKTDTASVLSEAIEYIKFLHEQVTALSTPYMKNGTPACMQHQQINSDKSKVDPDQGPKQDLRSRGLCLVPVSSTFPVTHETTVDFWTPTFGGTFR
ncbi:transcription factor bHLH123-like isoform X1 [Juglans microcarpa x Juglans regia]|uniref:transcription factor bHLH123-like isoform X1 n=1 Tax=Juglans microcarpa x Juglans regia TaxID=2249226 RepID=UPI001B7E509A|nr:transcription factor bHLH123-like isoform X1 [Juglans microcarpa x Juglans regia]